MGDLFFLTIILVIGFLLRYIMSISTSSDEDVTLALQKRQQGQKWVDYTVNDSIVEGYYGYPVFIHFILAKVSKKYRWYLGIFINIIVDIIVGVFVYIIVNNLIPSEITAYFNYGHIAVLIYITSPILIPTTARMKTIKGRSFGSMCVFFYLYFLSLILNDFSYELFIGLFIFSYFIILSSMFAFQVMVLISLFLSLLLFSFYPLLYLFIFLSIFLLFKQLKAKEPLLFYFNHKIWYFRNSSKGTTASNRELFAFLKLFYLFKTPKILFKNLIKNQPLFIVIISFPELYFLFDYFGIKIPQNHILEFSWYIILATIITFLLTSTKYLRFLGQSERYFEYTLPFFSILITFILYTNYEKIDILGIIILIMLWHIIITLFNFVFSNQKLFKHQNKLDNNFNQVINFLEQNYKDGGRVMAIPAKLGFKASAYTGSNSFKYYYKFMKKENELGFEYYEKDTNGLMKVDDDFIESKEIISLKPSEMIEKYNIDFLIIENTSNIVEGIKKMWEVEYHQMLDNIIFENESYLVYKL